MAKPPARSLLSFSAISNEAFIKQDKNGNFQMVMKNVESINWFTGRPERAEGSWKPKRLVKEWDDNFYFRAGTKQPDAQTSFREKGKAGKQGFASFKMFKPKINSDNNIKFKVNLISKNGKDSLANFVGKELDIASLFIDSSPPGEPSCFPDCNFADLRGLDMSGQQLFSNFNGADFSPKGTTRTNLAGARLSGAELIEANLTNANLTDAVLYNAYLWDANLTNANLTNANLSGASLLDANLTNANLTDAALYGVELNDADLTGANLTGVEYNSETY